MLFGYGQDALTQWFLSEHSGQFLDAVGDGSSRDDIVVFLRPSFGRGSRARLTGAHHCTFGEFDAIVGTPSATYLIEAKWTASIEAKGAFVMLSARQARRHKAMRAYLDEWRSTQPENWIDFLQRSNITPYLAELGLAPPGPRSRLAKNLALILRLLNRCGLVRDVLLFFRVNDEMTSARFGSPPTEVSEGHFLLVGVDCRTATTGGLVHLGRPGASLSPDKVWVSQFSGKPKVVS